MVLVSNLIFIMSALISEPKMIPRLCLPLAHNSIYSQDNGKILYEMYVKREKYAPAVLERFGIAHEFEDVGDGRKVLWLLNIGCGGKPLDLAQ